LYVTKPQVCGDTHERAGLRIRTEAARLSKRVAASVIGLRA
jgi:hypothetical protein